MMMVLMRPMMMLIMPMMRVILDLALGPHAVAPSPVHPLLLAAIAPASLHHRRVAGQPRDGQ
eukprot:3447939-Karenia_brevis.AAC.1